LPWRSNADYQAHRKNLFRETFRQDALRMFIHKAIYY
jgi:hypothetical protein